MMNTFNYVMQEGEQIVQCKEPYPAYWFMSNKGYLFSAYGNKIKVVKPNHRYTGTKNKDGSRTGQDRTGTMNTKLWVKNIINTLACTG